MPLIKNILIPKMNQMCVLEVDYLKSSLARLWSVLLPWSLDGKPHPRPPDQGVQSGVAGPSSCSVR